MFLPLCLKNPKREKHKLKSLKRLNSSGEFAHFKYRARPYNQLKRASSDIKGSAHLSSSSPTLSSRGCTRSGMSASDTNGNSGRWRILGGLAVTGTLGGRTRWWGRIGATGGRRRRENVLSRLGWQVGTGGGTGLS